jgi:hypothetical protein
MPGASLYKLPQLYNTCSIRLLCLKVNTRQTWSGCWELGATFGLYDMFVCHVLNGMVLEFHPFHLGIQAAH